VAWVQKMKITKTVLESILVHAKRDMPKEACGYLASRDGVICGHYELTNLDQASDHFSMDPKEQFAAIKDMRAQGMQMAAVYHSHPETPARPSDEDIRLAFDPAISYVIISMAAQEGVVKSFKIRKGEVTLEQMEIVEGEQ